jgi:hypothetical protein
LLRLDTAADTDLLRVTISKSLNFADLVGEILTGGITEHAPLPFKFYIWAIASCLVRRRRPSTRECRPTAH